MMSRRIRSAAELENLEAICYGRLSALKKLAITGVTAAFMDLKILEACSQLTELEVDDCSFGTESNKSPTRMDLSQLPPSLLVLKLTDVRVDASTLSQVNLTQLTQLRCCHIILREDRLFSLLCGLPELKEMEVRDESSLNPWSHKPAVIGEMWSRSENLTYLKLDLRCVSKILPLLVNAPALQSLHLCRETLDADWLFELCSALPLLTKLSFSDSQLTASEQPEIIIADEATPMPRELHLLRCQPMYIPWQWLESLTCSLVEGTAEQEEAKIQSIAGLSKLTYLKISNARESILVPLFSLKQLKILKIIDSGHQPFGFIINLPAGGFASLQELTIVDSSPLDEENLPTQPLAKEARAMFLTCSFNMTMNMLMEHPPLRKLTGVGALFIRPAHAFANFCGWEAQAADLTEHKDAKTWKRVRHVRRG